MWLSTSTALLARLLLVSICIDVAQSHTQIVMSETDEISPQCQLTISNVWQVLGPFQIGTRGMKAVWGADPLEQFGGFRALEYDDDAQFKSSLAPTGTATWSRRRFESNSTINGGASATLEFGFANVDWGDLKLAYGWSALQFQAWARGSINLNSTETKTFQVYTEGILEFWIDGESYFGGDMYSYRRAPLVFTFEPGRPYKIDLRLVHDVRAMGGVEDPIVGVGLEFRPVSYTLLVDLENVVAPDFVDGKLASNLLSLPVENVGNRRVSLTNVESGDINWSISLHRRQRLEIAPGQTKPLALEIVPSNDLSTNVSIKLVYQEEGETEFSTIVIRHELRNISQHLPHRFTFLRNGNIISHALIRPPQQFSNTSSTDQKSPVFVYLHGAGVKADSEQNSKVLDAISDLPVWTIFASGVTSWSGDDWHQWGWPDVEAAINTIPIWINNTKWGGPPPDIDKWLVVGHSNGGQGAWYALTHKPDNLLAVVTASGYLSIQKYVPYLFWHETDPRRMSVLHASMNSYRHELLVSNGEGIPIQQQHGDKDENVPVYHSRRMSQLIHETGWKSEYNELLGKGHYYEGIMATEPLRKFYSKYALSNDRPPKDNADFTLVSANPADTDSKFGLRIEALTDPGMLGKIQARHFGSTASLTTSNVQSLSFQRMFQCIQNIAIDGQDFVLADDSHQPRYTFDRNENGVWMASTAGGPGRRYARRGNQLGNLDAVLRSKDYFVIKSHHNSTDRLITQISRNLFQYFAADTLVLDSEAQASLTGWEGNLISVGIGTSMLNVTDSFHPIRLSASSLHIKDRTGHEREFTAKEHGLGAIFLRPLEDERLEIIVWGTDSDSAALAARLIPLTTGAGQPDFVVLTRECLWKGVDGTLALGFFDSSWNVSSSSFVM